MRASYTTDRCDTCGGSGVVPTAAEIEQEQQKQEQMDRERKLARERQLAQEQEEREKQKKFLEERELRNQEALEKHRKLVEQRELEHQKIIAQWQLDQEQRLRSKPPSIQVRPRIILKENDLLRHFQDTNLLEKIHDELRPAFSQMIAPPDQKPFEVCYLSRVFLGESKSSVPLVFDVSGDPVGGGTAVGEVAPPFWRFHEDIVTSVVNRHLNAVGWHIGDFAPDVRSQYPRGYWVSYPLRRTTT